MRSPIIQRTITHHFNTSGFCIGDVKKFVYLCPCGKGEIIEEHDNVPDCISDDVWIECSDCQEKYDIDVSKGHDKWEVVEK